MAFCHIVCDGGELATAEVCVIMRLIELWFFRAWTSVYFLKNIKNLYLSEGHKLQNSMGSMILCVYVYIHK